MMRRGPPHWRKRRPVTLDQSLSDPPPSLHLMCRNGEFHVVTQLIKNGASINAKDQDGLTPLHYAAANGHLDIVKILLEHSADIDLVDDHIMDGTKLNRTALHRSICFGHKEVASLIIERGADVNQRDADGFAPLDMAILEDQGDIAETLIQNGADINAADGIGYTALHFAIEDNDIKLVNLLIKHGANVNVGDNNLLRPLHLSAKMRLKEITQILIENGANVNSKTVSGGNPLHVALVFGENGKSHEEIIETLIWNGIDINDVVIGFTALHYCIFKNYRNYVKILIQYGASLKIKSSRGNTPFECSLRFKGYDSIKLLTYFNH